MDSLQKTPVKTKGIEEHILDNSAYFQWRIAMRQVTKSYTGLPSEFRFRLWKNLADRYFYDNKITWGDILRKCQTRFPEDRETEEQIEKDLHRTGLEYLNGSKQKLLKDILICYSRWNRKVGYCQGFNMIGAVLLEISSGDKINSLKIFIFIIDGVLPPDYFSNGLKDLILQLNLFRHILKKRKPSLTAHLRKIQENPCLTDLHTINWFLTLFLHILPMPSVLRIWDLLLLEGVEILLRVALVLWATIEVRLLPVTSTDQFYSIMEGVSREMLECGLLDTNVLIKCVISLGPFPYPGLEQLRLKIKYTLENQKPQSFKQKAFFLPKRELDNLKKQFDSIKNRQIRPKTIISNCATFNSNIKKNIQPQNLSQRLINSTRPEQMLNRTTTKIQIQPKVKNISLSAETDSTKLLQEKPIARMRSPKPCVTMKWDRSKKLKKLKNKLVDKGNDQIIDGGSSSSDDTDLCDTDPAIDSSDDDVQKNINNDNDVETTTPINDTETNNSNNLEQLDILAQMAISIVNDSSNQIKEEDLQEEEKEGGGGVSLESSIFTLQNTEDLDLKLHYDLEGEQKSEDFYIDMNVKLCEIQFQNLKVLSNCNLETSQMSSFEIDDYEVDQYDVNALPNTNTDTSPTRNYNPDDKCYYSFQPTSNNNDNNLSSPPLSPLNLGNSQVHSNEISPTAAETAEGNKLAQNDYSMNFVIEKLTPPIYSSLTTSEDIPCYTLSGPDNDTEINTSPTSCSNNKSPFSEIIELPPTNSKTTSPINFDDENENENIPVKPEPEIENSSLVLVKGVLDEPEPEPAGPDCETSSLEMNDVISQNIAILGKIKTSSNRCVYASDDSTTDDDDDLFLSNNDLFKNNSTKLNLIARSSKDTTTTTTNTNIGCSSKNAKSKTSSAGAKNKNKKIFNPFPTTRVTKKATPIQLLNFKFDESN